MSGVVEMDRLESRLRNAGPRVRELIERVPLQSTPPLPPEWMRYEMLERLEVLGQAGIGAGARILEVGSGAHALATVPLAHVAGPSGRVIAAERSRWAQFRGVVASCGVGDRIRPVACDARRLPLRDDCVDWATCIHAVRSLRGEENIVRIIGEMLRVAPRLFVAESLPLARTDAQRAHLAMYDLRQDVFFAASGTRDDLRYDRLELLVSYVERAGGVVERTATMDVDLPHWLAYFPRALVESARPGVAREPLLRRWDEAAELLRKFGEDHPPVGIVVARRA
jgi:hypothetical protein